MAVQITIRGEIVFVVNVYSPSGKDQAQLCDVLKDDMERAEEDRAISTFHATAHTYFTLFLAMDQQVLDLFGDV